MKKLLYQKKKNPKSKPNYHTNSPSLKTLNLLENQTTNIICKEDSKYILSVF